jgi:hypothetical protein
LWAGKSRPACFELLDCFVATLLAMTGIPLPSLRAKAKQSGSFHKNFPYNRQQYLLFLPFLIFRRPYGLIIAGTENTSKRSHARSRVFFVYKKLARPGVD